MLGVETVHAARQGSAAQHRRRSGHHAEHAITREIMIRDVAGENGQLRSIVVTIKYQNGPTIADLHADDVYLRRTHKKDAMRKLSRRRRLHDHRNDGVDRRRADGPQRGADDVQERARDQRLGGAARRRQPEPARRHEPADPRPPDGRPHHRHRGHLRCRPAPASRSRGRGRWPIEFRHDRRRRRDAAAAEHLDRLPARADDQRLARPT